MMPREPRGIEIKPPKNGKFEFEQTETAQAADQTNGAVIGGTIMSGWGQAIASGIDAITNGIIAGKNLQHQKELLEYQKQLDAINLARSDTSFQRTIADMKLAGLNPAMLNASAQGGQTIQPTDKQAPQMQKIGQMSSILANMQAFQKGSADIAKTTAETKNIDQDTANKEQDEYKKMLDNDYYTKIADDRIQKYQAEIDNLTTDVVGKKQYQAIQEELRKGNKTLQELAIEGNRIYNLMMSDEQKMTHQDWLFMEQWQISRNMTPEEKRANYYKMEKLIKTVDGKEQLVTEGWLNNMNKQKEMLQEIQFRNNLDLGKGLVLDSTQAFNNIASGLGRGFWGFGHLFGKPQNKYQTINNVYPNR